MGSGVAGTLFRGIAEPGSYFQELRPSQNPLVPVFARDLAQSSDTAVTLASGLRLSMGVMLLKKHTHCFSPLPSHLILKCICFYLPPFGWERDTAQNPEQL